MTTEQVTVNNGVNTQALLDARDALENAPELQSLDRSIEAQQIQVDQFKRRYVLPRFYADAAYSEQLTSPEGPIFPDDDTYSVSVNAAYPLFEGGRRKADLARARSDQETLVRQQRLVAELIEHGPDLPDVVAVTATEYHIDSTGIFCRVVDDIASGNSAVRHE